MQVGSDGGEGGGDRIGGLIGFGAWVVTAGASSWRRLSCFSVIARVFSNALSIILGSFYRKRKEKERRESRKAQETEKVKKVRALQRQGIEIRLLLPEMEGSESVGS
ncbi:hypothetical protein O6H91_Y380600 [Diphasiastrum complanatum]|nr:hypothetical protein O6H91_Y380600 [Diphasiastrum complanatum]